MEQIVDKFLGELAGQLSAKKVEIVLEAEARAWLASKGFDPAYGARPLGRLIQKEIKDVLAGEILFGELANGGLVSVSLNARQELDFRYAPR